jgi:tRNA(Arg) A34 adenosine deaminase TadA
MRRKATEIGDQGYGAVVVRDGIIVGQSPSHVVVHRDPTAHAEMEAIRDAARRLGNRDLTGCTLYSSSSACPMCEAAAYWANIDRMVFGSAVTEGGRPRLCR